MRNFLLQTMRLCNPFFPLVLTIIISLLIKLFLKNNQWYFGHLFCLGRQVDCKFRGMRDS